VCEPLVWEPEPGKFMPGLADSWEISPDAKEYTFKLKKGVKFHDGTPFNAQAVKFTMDRVIDPATKAGQSHDQLGPYDHTDVVDDNTARIVMKQPYAPLLTKCTSIRCAGISAGALSCSTMTLVMRGIGTSRNDCRRIARGSSPASRSAVPSGDSSRTRSHSGQRSGS